MTNMGQISVLITGGNKGLGLESARRLGEHGWTVFLGSRDEARGQAAADMLAADGANVVMVPLDVTSDESVTDAVRLDRSESRTRSSPAAGGGPPAGGDGVQRRHFRRSSSTPSLPARSRTTSSPPPT
jgi:NAD(P)-dependent dehydrogenase (short-subunit alcohol dehydrogenase family)